MSITRYISCVLLAALVWTIGCARTANPLAGWKPCSSDDPVCSNQTIKDDYQDYIQKLPPKEKVFFQGGISFYEDGAGRHAVKIETPYYGVWREHALIYDKDDRRIKVITYSGGKYRS